MARRGATGHWGHGSRSSDNQTSGCLHQCPYSVSNHWH
jgi:hypothetical protein